MATFTFNKKGGYEPMEVDSYINSLEKQLKEYEDKGEAIQKAFINATMASDKMMKEATAEANSVVKKATDEATDILKKANEEKGKILAEAQAAQVAIAANAGNQLKEIRSAIAKQKAFMSSFDKEYKAMVDKYLTNYDGAEVEKASKGLEEVDAMVAEWEKSGVPKVEEKPAHQMPQTAMQRVAAMNGMNISTPKPAPAPEATAPKPENDGPKAMPSPLTASSVSKPATPVAEEPKQQEAPKPFIKTGLAGGAGMGGIPANPSYGLGGERNLRNSVSHSEAPKQESAPEPVSAPSVDVPKFGESNNQPNQESATPKPGIYKVSADNHLYNNNRPAQPAVTPTATPSPAPANPTPNAAAPQAAPASNVPKPGIYKVSADNHLYNDNTEA